MSKVQMLRAFVNQRLSAAAEEIFELFERTIAEYEQHLYRSQGDRERLREHLDSAVDLHGADTQQMLVGEAEVFSQQHDWNTNLEHVDQPEMSHIKEEQKEPWSSQEEERSQKLRETTGITEFSFFPATVKSENDEKSQSSELHQCLTAKKSEAELPEAGSNGDSHRGSELAKNLLPYRHLEPNRDHDISHYSEHVSAETNDCAETRGSYLASYLNVLRNSDVNVSDSISNSVKKSFSCADCGKTFASKGNLKTHMTCHTGEKPFVCPMCGKRFRQNSNMVTHVRIHTAERPFTCTICKASFTQRGTLHQHMRIHTGEKPYSCSMCGKRFTQKGSVTQHMTVHTGEKPFNCSVCGKRFDRPSLIRNHRCVYATDA
ncbi:Gastrula zinc finger protein XlCGF57.1 [Channa argus]|uniref:Gastrula zinc finger protein XlCGF57.1 n=1 Tax=Channa argus TaxID=215402 RepID=A0A6G1QW74_CHAAH|nr:Gastrula zinc finger protein XlCGF57.1 [Channa argus]